MTTQTQYGGTRAPAVSGNGGAAVLGGVANAALGMLSGGGLPAIQAAMDVAKDGNTSQTAAVHNTISTGSKTFGSPQGSDGLSANSFWQATLRKESGGSLVIVLAVAVIGATLYFVTRRK